MITDIEDFFTKGCGRCERFDTPQCSSQIWNDGVRKLRSICLEAGRSEHVKWGHPCYMHAGRNIAIIGALQRDFRFTFFEGGLLQDPQGVLQKQGPNCRYPSTLHFTDPAAVTAMKDTILAYLEEAKGYAEQGLKNPKVEEELELPEELVAAMDADPERAEAFHDLTPGRQRSYQVVIGGAKKSETRVNRILKLRPKILAGKGANEY